MLRIYLLLAVSVAATSVAKSGTITIVGSSSWEQSLDQLVWVPAEVPGFSLSVNGFSVPAIWPSGVGEGLNVYFRYSFRIPGAPISGILYTYNDDDAIINVNGTTVLTDLTTNAEPHGPIDLLPVLKAGTNTIEARVWSTYCCGRFFAPQVTLQYSDVPEGTNLLLVTLGLGSLAVLRRRS